MSFSKSVKEELSKISNLKDKQSVKAEFIGYLLSNNVSIKDDKIKYSTESEYNINRFAKLLNNINIEKYNIDIQGKVFYIEFKKNINIPEVSILENKICLNDNLEQFLNNEVLQKSIVRGAFLGSGSINNPEKKYHLEIIFNSEENMEFVKQLLNKYSIKMKSFDNSLYAKEGEEISKFLAFIGANNSVLKFEEIRVIRDMRNNVNRIVNCETANINKTINASLKQIEDIKFIIKMNKFHELSENLQEIANLRLENPEVSIVELGRLLSNPIGKSGVNYRLKAISEFAEELRNGTIGDVS